MKHAKEMIPRANVKSGKINIGNIIEININRVDLTKTDCNNLTLMVIQEKTLKRNH